MAVLGAALTVFVAAFAAVLITRWASDAANAAAFTGPQQLPFTGGHPPQTHAWNRYHVRYYTMALLFLVFDMEMVFMYPWAVVFAEEGLIALVEMLMFIVILLLGILYAWRERALEWA
jgi:NADH:ubiquinone oxidoreductase subunit 3 (subunit A)